MLLVVFNLASLTALRRERLLGTTNDVLNNDMIEQWIGLNKFLFSISA